MFSNETYKQIDNLFQDSENLLNKTLRNVHWINSNLNPEQKRCVLAILSLSQLQTRPKLPFIIHGPPGTGKTVTLVEMTLQVLNQSFDNKVLIVAPSNSAADLLATRLLNSSLRASHVIRLNAFQRPVDSISKDLSDISMYADELHNNHRVLVTTASTAAVLNRFHYTHLLIDEAGQLTEPETCVVMSMVSEGTVVLCGDASQLGPVVMSNHCKRANFHQSLLHRLTSSPLYGNRSHRDPLLICQLVRNYRSDPAILHVFSHLYYDSTLLAMKCHENSAINKWMSKFHSTSSVPILFHGVVGMNMRDDDCPSWYNISEAYQCVRYAKSLIQLEVPPKKIGIITPYKKQVRI